jgi:hypothetical protein
MKKVLITVCVLILATAVFYSCTKNTRNEPLTEEQAVRDLSVSESFIDFSKHLITDFAALAKYHRSAGILADKNAFLAQVKYAGDNIMQRAATYQGFGLDYENALALKNKVDNDLLKLLNDYKFLSAFDDKQTERIVMNAIDAGFRSTDERWLRAKEEITGNLQAVSMLRNAVNQHNGTRTDFAAAPAAGLSADEAWDCLKGAAGFGTAGILGVGALKKLVGEGFQAVVLTVSKWLAERAGWFGLAIMLIDFGSCIYKEAND